MGFRKLSARPRHHAQDEGAIAAFKKTFSPSWRRSHAKRVSVSVPIEIWFGDEARIGQKNKITRRWAKRGTRPSAPQDQRTASTYIFGAICPSEGKGCGLILPACNTEAMTLHLAEISYKVAAGRHAAVLVDQAAWHLSGHLVVPDNITILPLPPSVPNSTRRKTSGSSCATTGSRTACSPVTTTLSIIAVMPGTSSSLSPGGSCHSEHESGRMGPNHRVLVLDDNGRSCERPLALASFRWLQRMAASHPLRKLIRLSVLDDGS